MTDGDIKVSASNPKSCTVVLSFQYAGNGRNAILKSRVAAAAGTAEPEKYMTLSRMPEPDRTVLDRSAAIIKDLEALIGLEGVISEEEGRRAFETDALTAYRQIPLAVVLPRSTEDVSKLLKYCHQNQLKVVPRGAGTSLCGGALPSADSIVIGTSRMNRVIEADFVNRTITVEAGITNLAITDAVSAEGFFYAPDPSSQLACTVGGNLAMNSGGAHCLKYGVTTNNVLGVKIVLMDGEIVEIGGPYLDSEGYDFLALIVGSEGQFGIVTEATLQDPAAGRSGAPGDARLQFMRGGWSVRRRHHRLGHHPRRHRVHGQAGHRRVRGVRQGRLSARRRGLLIVEVEGFEDEIARLLARHRRDRPRVRSEGRSRRAPRPSKARASGRAARRRSAPWAASPTTTAWTAPSRWRACPRC